MTTTIELASLTAHSSSTAAKETILGYHENSPEKALQIIWCMGLPLDKTLEELFDSGNSMTLDRELAAAFSARLWTLFPSPEDTAVIDECAAHNSSLRDASARKNILELLKKPDYEYRMVPCPTLLPHCPNHTLPTDIYRGAELIRADWADDGSALPPIAVRAALHPAFASLHADNVMYWVSNEIQSRLVKDVVAIGFAQSCVRSSSPPTLEEYELANY